MPWFKVDDKLHDHRKTRAAGVAAMGLWTLAGTWSMDNLTDGFVPESVCARWDRAWKRLGAKLVEVGYWEQGELNSEPGWWFHDWKDIQRSKADIESERHAATERQRRAREAARSQRESQRDTTVTDLASHAVTPPLVTVPQTRPDQTIKKDITESFTEFWEIYPRRQGKRGAEGEFTRALRRASLEQILAGAKRYRDDPNRVDEFTKHPSTWLHNDCWADELLPARGVQATTETGWMGAS